MEAHPNLKEILSFMPSARILFASVLKFFFWPIYQLIGSNLHLFVFATVISESIALKPWTNHVYPQMSATILL